MMFPPSPPFSIFFMNLTLTPVRATQFETERWDLILEDGTVIPLLDGQRDPSAGLQDE